MVHQGGSGARTGDSETWRDAIDEAETPTDFDRAASIGGVEGQSGICD